MLESWKVPAFPYTPYQEFVYIKQIRFYTGVH